MAYCRVIRINTLCANLVVHLTAAQLATCENSKNCSLHASTTFLINLYIWSISQTEQVKAGMSA